jgi:hypothetical protein
MLEMLDKLWSKLSDSEQQERKTCYDRLKRCIEQAPPSGIPALLSKSFRNSKVRGGVRMDLEIREGSACVDNPTSDSEVTE